MRLWTSFGKNVADSTRIASNVEPFARELETQPMSKLFEFINKLR